MKKKPHISAILGRGKGSFYKAIKEAFLLSRHDKDAFNVALRYFGNECAYCGASGNMVTLGGDHLIPTNEGGRYVRGNIVPACQKCNSDRRDEPVESFLKDPNRLRKINEFRKVFLVEPGVANLEEALGEAFSAVQQLDTVLSLIRDVARNSARSCEQGIVPDLNCWIMEVRASAIKYGLIKDN